jgi:hypothetical protein
VAKKGAGRYGCSILEVAEIIPDLTARRDWRFLSSTMTHDMQTQTPEEQQPAEEAAENFVIFVCPVDGLPATYTAKNKSHLKHLIKMLYMANDQQYMYVVKGELGKLAKRNNRLLVSFQEDNIKVSLGAKVQQLTDGWLGN